MKPFKDGGSKLEKSDDVKMELEISTNSKRRLNTWTTYNTKTNNRSNEIRYIIQ